MVIVEASWVNVDDGTQLAEAGRDPLQVLVLLWEVDSQDRHEPFLLDGEAVGHLLRVLQGEASAIVSDGAEADRGRTNREMV